jgi:hypothetical protein
MTSLLLCTLIAIIISGLMVGNEIAVGLFVHPKLWTLPAATHLQAAQPLARIYGAVMPFWYVATLLISVLLTYQFHNLPTAEPFRLALIASLLWALSIGYTLWGLVPINSQIAKWDLSHPPADWQAQRQLWDTRHRWRVAGLVLAFVLLTLAGLLGLANR